MRRRATHLDLVEKAGFSAVYISGAGLANATAGVPDVGLLTLTEVAQLAGYIAHAVNIPAIVILAILSALLIRGMQESATVNSIIVVTKVAIVLMVIVIGWGYMNPANHTPYMIPANTPGHEGFFKHGWGGMLGGAAAIASGAFAESQARASFTNSGLRVTASVRM